LVSYDVKERRPVIFSQQDAGNKDPDYYIRDVLRGSSAAPTYFEPARIKSLDAMPKTKHLIDGGVSANDPALCAYSEALKMKLPNGQQVSGIEDMTIVSLGTGKPAVVKGITVNEAKDWGVASWAKPVLEITFDSGPQMVSYHLDKIDSTTSGTNYYRLESDLLGASKRLDDASPENVNELVTTGKLNALAFDALLDDIVSNW